MTAINGGAPDVAAAVREAILAVSAERECRCVDSIARRYGASGLIVESFVLDCSANCGIGVAQAQQRIKKLGSRGVGGATGLQSDKVAADQAIAHCRSIDTGRQAGIADRQ